MTELVQTASGIVVPSSVAEDKSVKSGNPANAVSRFHDQDDVDSNADAHHHTLGYRRGQAAPGDLVKKFIDYNTPCGIAGVLGAAQSIAASAFVRITNWSTTQYFGGTYVDGTEYKIVWQGAGLWKITEKGWFDIDLTVSLAGPSNSGSSIYAGLELNGVRFRSTGQSSNQFGSGLTFSYSGILNVNDLIGFQMFQNFANPASVVGDVSGGDYRTYYSIVRRCRLD